MKHCGHCEIIAMTQDTISKSCNYCGKNDWVDGEYPEEKIINYNHPYFRNMPQSTTNNGTQFGAAKGTSGDETTNGSGGGPKTNNLEGWSEIFDKEFTFVEDDIKYFKLDYHYINKDDEDDEQWYTEAEPVKQFISELRKHDMVELIKMLPKKKLGHINQEGFCDDCHFKICRCCQINSVIDTFKQLIKDYYNK